MRRGGAFLALFCMVACDDKPFHSGRTFDCETFKASFAGDGRTVAVEINGKQVTLRNKRTLAFFEDTYRDRGYRLVADPEILLFLPDGTMHGPCGY